MYLIKIKLFNKISLIIVDFLLYSHLFLRVQSPILAHYTYEGNNHLH